MPIGQKLNPTLCDFIVRQPMFFVATAARDGRVNVSPKGMDSLRIIDERRLVWLNLTGSGNETAAHIADTNRMTLMFCAFEGPALILRLYGTARAIHPRDAEWDSAAAGLPAFAGRRQIFDMAIDSVQTSCGTGVPLMHFESQRGLDELVPHWEREGEDRLHTYWRKRNVSSIDGKPTGILADE